MDGPVGMIGLGTIGRPVAEHLLTRDRELVVYDRRSAAVEPLLQQGAANAADPHAVAEQVSTLLLSLPTPEIVDDVVSTAAPGLESGDVVIDLSTSDPSVTDTLAATLRADGVSMLSAPVSGGAVNAKSGSLSVMVGGNRAAYERCRPLFEAFATDVLYVSSSPAAGHTAKLLNNFVSFACFMATAEAAILGQARGLELERLLEVINASSGRNVASSEKFPREVTTGEFDVGFTIDLMAKDINLYTELAESQQTPTQLATTTRDAIVQAQSEHSGGDMTRLYTYLETLADGQ